MNRDMWSQERDASRTAATRMRIDPDARLNTRMVLYDPDTRTQHAPSQTHTRTSSHDTHVLTSLWTWRHLRVAHAQHRVRVDASIVPWRTAARKGRSEAHTSLNTASHRMALSSCTCGIGSAHRRHAYVGTVMHCVPYPSCMCACVAVVCVLCVCVCRTVGRLIAKKIELVSVTAQYDVTLPVR